MEINAGDVATWVFQFIISLLVYMGINSLKDIKTSVDSLNRHVTHLLTDNTWIKKQLDALENRVDHLEDK